MTVAIALRFPAGRFHATPWGRHPNEGVPEWPPSPWRLLRAIVATWRRKFMDEPAVGEALPSALACLLDPPHFVLPRASVGHTRQYVPAESDRRTLVFDTFVSLEPADEVLALWPHAQLAEGERRVLAQVLAGLGYLGRAESLCQARLLTVDETDGLAPRGNCVPDAAPGQETVRVLCAGVDALGSEHTPRDEIAPARRGQPAITAARYRPDWHLCFETADLDEARWSSPPGARWVTYGRDRHALTAIPARRTAPRGSRRFTVARFALDGAVLPSVTETLRVGERMRVTLMGAYRRAEEEALARAGQTLEPGVLPRSEIFAGKDARGAPLVGHRHGFFLPSDEDRDGRIDHITVMAEAEFGPGELAALDRVRRLKLDGGEGTPLQLLLLAVATAEEACRRRVPGPPWRRTLLEPARAWISATPFLVTRHPKRSGRKRDAPALLGRDNAPAFVEQVLREELARLRERRPDVPEPERVERLEDGSVPVGDRRLRPIEFRRFRSRPDDDGGRRPSGAFRIVFPVEVRGPIALGHSSHFGLGLFVPED